MKKSYIACIFTLLSTYSINSFADLSGEITLASEYLNQGFTQTDNKPALQGNLEWNNNSGWHTNVWATTVDVNNIDLEANWVAGYIYSINDKTNLDLAVKHYSYFGDPKASKSDYTEYYFSLDMENWVFTNSWSFDIGGTNTTHTILEAIYYHQLPVGTLEFLVDYSYLLDDDEIEYDGDKSYTHWKISYSYNIQENIKLITAYDGTDYKSSYDPDNEAGDRISVSITYSF